jgi:hypothetical protein
MTMKEHRVVQNYTVIFRMATLLSSHSLSVELQRDEIARVHQLELNGLTGLYCLNLLQPITGVS